MIRLCAFIILVMFSLTLSPAQACSPQDKQFYKMVTEDFCEFLKTERKPTDALFTVPLLKAIQKANMRNIAWEQKNLGDKPPLGDGIPYQAFPDHAPKCAPGTNLHVDHTLHMEVMHSFPKEPKANWTDHLILMKTEHGWKIDDIRYAPDYKTGLRDALKDAFKP